MAHARRQSSGSREHCQDTRHPISIVQEFDDVVGDARTTKFPRRDIGALAARIRAINRLFSTRGINPVTRTPEKNRPIRVSAKNEIIGGAARARRRGRAKGV